MAVLTINHYINQAACFIDSISDTSHAYYMFAGKPKPWSNEASPPAANSSINQYESTVYDDLMFGKLIDSASVSHLIPRYNWTSNTVYAAYDQTDSDLYSKQFYVVTSNFQVYKCIFNSNDSASTVMPTLASTTGTFKTGDGYVWKYMYTVSSAANVKFTSAGYVPVTANAAVKSNTTPGSIDAMRVINGGTNYSIRESGYIGGMISSTVVQLPSNTSAIDNVYAKSSLYLKSGPGAGQIKEILSSNGAAKTITVASPFITYYSLYLANVLGTVATGYQVTQSYTQLNYQYPAGYFSTGANVNQSDTGAYGQIVTANSSIIRVVLSPGSAAFALYYPLRDMSDAGTLKTGNVTVTNVGALTYAFVTNSGSGYTGNTTVTVTDPNSNGISGTANAQANSVGKISNVNISAAGTLYFVEPNIVIAAPANTTFNANSNVIGANSGIPNNSISLSSASSFAANDLITYAVATGNTAVGGLANGTTYYVDAANSTYISLKASASGTRIALTKGPTQSGHALKGSTATARVIPDTMIVKGGNSTMTQFTDTANGYANNDYIRVYTNANTNIRRVANVVNSSLLLVTIPFSTTLSQANTSQYKMTVATAEVSSISVVPVTGYVANTNLSSKQLAVNAASFSLPGVSFIAGEIVDLVDSSNNTQAANGIVAYSNTSTMILASITGAVNWANSANLYVRGESSLQRAQIEAVQSYESITINNTSGLFTAGRMVYFSTGASASGNALVVQTTTIPNDTTEYVIGPTVSITGDGSNAIAIAIVNTDFGSANNVISVDFIGTGSGYTYANVQVYANGSYGSGANLDPVISPIRGHGYDTVTELGGRYVGVDVTFDTSTNEVNYFPAYVQYRRVGILEDPQFEDVRVNLSNFDRVNLTLSGTVTSNPNVSITTWQPGEVVTQNTTSAAGVVVYGNSTFLQLKNVLETFSVSNAIYGYYSNTTANVVTANVNYFEVGSSSQIISETTSRATGIVTQLLSNTQVVLSNVQGQFVTGDVMYDPTTNTYATVGTILTANGSRDETSIFGTKFNQTLRITLTSSAGSFASEEQVIQEVSMANGYVVSAVGEKDLSMTVSVSTFAVGDTVRDTTSNANGIVLFANTTYLKLTAVSNTLSFGAGHTINNQGSAVGNISAVYPVLLLNDVNGPNKFQAGSNNIVGQTSGATGVCNSYALITYPELVRESGKVIYMENFQYVTKAPASKEEVKLVIKF